jgi:poly(3-hydroxybutyrate) depolymerase
LVNLAPKSLKTTIKYYLNKQSIFVPYLFSIMNENLQSLKLRSLLAAALIISSLSSIIAQQVPKRSPEGVGYLEYLPEGYRTSGKRYPVLFFLHGLGEKGDGSDAQIWRVATHGPPAYIKNGHKMNFTYKDDSGKEVEETFIVISPQLSNLYGSFDDILPAFIPFVFENYQNYIDRSRIYITGLSMGGGSVWRMPTQFPQWFAAAVPVCAAAWPDERNLPSVFVDNNIPVWAHHGNPDPTIQFVHSQHWVGQINQSAAERRIVTTPNPLARLSEYANVGHSAWGPAYQVNNSLHTPNIYQWLLQFRKTVTEMSAGPEVVTWNGSKWTPRAPTSKDEVIISGPFPGTNGVLATASDRTFSCQNLRVLINVPVNITSGSSITINGLFDNYGVVTVENGGSLVQTANSRLGLNTAWARFTVQRQRYSSQVSGSGIGYNFWSSPIAGLTSSALPGPAGGRFGYSEPIGAWQPAPTNLAAGRGYTALLTGVNTRVEYTAPSSGWPNNGNIVVPVTRTSTSSFAGFNLLGNPYPSAIDLRAFFSDADNSRLNGSAWFWDDNDAGQGSGSYVVANLLTGTRFAPVCQGFFVSATSSGNVTFKNAHRVAGNNTMFFRNEEPEETFERAVLLIEKDSARDRTFLGFGRTFTDQFDRLYDAPKVDNPSGLNLSLVWEGSRWGALALPEGQMKPLAAIPVSLQAREGGSFKITLNEEESSVRRPMFLEDRATGEHYFLQPNRTHLIDIQAGTHHDRFFLRFGNEVVGTEDGQASDQPIRAYSYGNQLYLFTRGGLAGQGEVVLYSMTGVLVESFPKVQLGSAIQRLRTQVGTPGVYILKISLAGQTYEQRVWLEK